MNELAYRLREAVSRGETKLRDMGDAEAGRPLREGGWSSKEVIGHLIDSASNNHQRFVRLMLANDLALPGYEQAGWVQSQRYNERPWTELLSLWAAYNRHIAHIFANMPESALKRTCRIGGAEPVTLEFVMNDYLVHLEHHLSSL